MSISDNDLKKYVTDTQQLIKETPAEDPRREEYIQNRDEVLDELSRRMK